MARAARTVTVPRLVIMCDRDFTTLHVLVKVNLNFKLSLLGPLDRDAGAQASHGHWRFLQCHLAS